MIDPVIHIDIHVIPLIIALVMTIATIIVEYKKPDK